MLLPSRGLASCVLTVALTMSWSNQRGVELFSGWLVFDIISQTRLCKYCMDGMLEAGLTENQRSGEVCPAGSDTSKMTALIRQYNKECTIFYNAGHVSPYRDILDTYTPRVGILQAAGGAMSTSPSPCGMRRIWVWVS